jgi:carbamoyltransferase
MRILGLACHYHDAAACLLEDGVPVAAAAEERFTRKKHDAEFPYHAANWALRSRGLSANDLDYVVFYDKPFLKFARIISCYTETFPFSLRSFLAALPAWFHEKLWLRSLIRSKLDYDGPILFSEHHRAHGASAFFASPFEDAAILTADGVGEWATGSRGEGEANHFQIFDESRFPHSLGLLYTAFTYFLGFRVNSAEYKVMGLAPYGEPRYRQLMLDEIVDLREDGSFRLNLKYFAYHYGLTMTNRLMEELFGVPRREADGEVLREHRDIAASIQSITEEIMVRQAADLYRRTGRKNLCIAGGVGLNCVANRAILDRTPFDEIFIQPAAGDDGGALGAALEVYYSALKNERRPGRFSPYLGPEFSADDIREYLSFRGLAFREFGEPRDLIPLTAAALENNAVIGWFQGRMEYGPRALGSRSILADPRFEENKERVNAKIKFREEFRPFAPSVAAEAAGEFFDLPQESPYMLLVGQVRPERRVIPAITHVDGSARVQTVAAEDNSLYHDLIAEFGRRTGVPVLLNTSFNIRGQPIVCTPHDAVNTFLATDIDYLVMDRFLLDKAQMAGIDAQEWRSQFEPD